MMTKTQKNILLTLGITSGIGFLSLIGYKLYKSKQRSSAIPVFIPSGNVDSNTSGNTNSGSSSSNDSFPLKKGSKGNRVKQLQNALISKYGNSILSRFGADGDFGNETVKALQSKGLPTEISSDKFNIIVNGQGIDALFVARKLRQAAIDKNFNQALFILQGLRSVDDYVQVSNAFKGFRTFGVHKTLVNGMLDAFQAPDRKQKIRNEFIRMGLKLRNGVFSLNGFDNLQPVKTRYSCPIYHADSGKICHKVMPNCILGTFITKQGNWILFKPIGIQSIFKIHAKNIYSL